MKKIIYSDLDGTLFSLIDGQVFISDENIKAINNWINDGHLFGVATGRNIGGIKHYFNDIDVDFNLPFVLTNGTLVYDMKNNHILYKDILNKMVLEEAISFYKTHRNYVRIAISYPHEEFILVDKDSRPLINVPFFNQTITFEELDFSQVLKILFIIDEIHMEEYTQLINQFDSKEYFDIFQSGINFLEVVNRGANKKRAIDVVLKQLRLESSSLYTIGDFNNDYEMIRESNLGFATSNAVKEIKEVADYIVTDYNNHAISEMIKILNKLLID